MTRINGWRGATILSLLACFVVGGGLVGSVALGSGGVQQLKQGDVDCDGSITTRDNQGLLRSVLQQNALGQTEPCPDVGSLIALAATPAPTPTPPSGYTFTFPGFYADPDNFEGIVTSLMLLSTIPGSGSHDPVEAPPGARFAVLFVNVNNFGSEPDFTNPFSFRLTDSLSRSFTMDFDNDAEASRNAEDYYGRLGTYRTVQPGIPVDMVFVFQVPLGATGLVASRCPSDGSGC